MSNLEDERDSHSGDRDERDSPTDVRDERDDHGDPEPAGESGPSPGSEADTRPGDVTGDDGSSGVAEAEWLPPAIAPALSMLADGLLAGLLAILLLRSFLPSRPLALPTGASSAGVVLLGVFAFVCGAVLSVRGRLVHRGPSRVIDGLLVLGTVSIASLIAVPVLGVDLPTPTLAVGVLGIGALLGAATLALDDPRLMARRGVAVGLDGVLEFALWYGFLWQVLPLMGVPSPTGGTWTEIVGAVLLLYVSSAVVRVPFETIDGRSLGKRLSGVRVVDETGDSPDFRSVLVRNLVRPVDSLPIGYVIGSVCVAASDGEARIGDVLAGTQVERDDG
jgi:uncharacterized RDD family membrane protein YckC